MVQLFTTRDIYKIITIIKDWEQISNCDRKHSLNNPKIIYFFCLKLIPQNTDDKDLYQTVKET